jgi:hypothetical protein
MTNKMTIFATMSASLALVASSKGISVIDLSGGPPAQGSANGAYLFAADPQPTGTGVIDPFLREQNKPSEFGINTSISKPPYDDKPGPWTHDLQVSSLATVSYNSVNYYKFSLDANQSFNGPISLTTFKIFVTGGSPFTSASDLMNLVNTGTAAFDLNGAGAVRVDISSQNGSGSGDMYILVPTSDIGTTGNLYLYAGFGLDTAGGGYESNSGFEEWNATTGNQPRITTPDGGSTMMLLGSALAGMYFLRRKFAHS